jgi:hypothetical protein
LIAVKPNAKQEASYFRLRIVLVIAISLLALPYLVDVGYAWDLTPTHSAQEILSDKDNDIDDEVSLGLAYVQDNAVVIETISLLPGLLALRPERFRERALSPFEYLSIASLISRPPPVA